MGSLTPTLVILFLFSACGQSTTKPGVTADGYCGSNFVTDYNNLVNKVIDTNKTFFDTKGSVNDYAVAHADELKATFKTLDTQCKTFFAAYGSVSCQALSDKTKQSFTASSEDNRKNCNSVAKSLKKMADASAQANTPATVN